MARSVVPALAAVMMVCALVPSALAERVRRAEQPSVIFMLTELQPAAEGQAVGNGGTIWTARGLPEEWVTTGEVTPKLVRPSSVPSLPEGSPMYRVDLESGVAWCAPFDPTKGVRATACIRDFDDDDQAEGVYVAEARGIKSQHLPAILRGLVGMGYKIPLVPSDMPNDIDGRVEARIEGARRGWPRIRLYVDEERLDTLLDCRPAPEFGTDVCAVSGALLQRSAPGAATYLVIDHTPEMTLPVRTTGILEGSGKRS